MNWMEILEAIEPFEEIDIDTALVTAMQSRMEAKQPHHAEPLSLYTPTFKAYQTSEISACGKNRWPAVSITGADCKLQCDHCKARILEPMLAARTPEQLWQTVNTIVADGATGMLLTGGSNHQNEVEYGPYLNTIARIKQEFPDFRIAAHAALMSLDTAHALDQAGIDVAMMDVIGAQETITQVYHLRRSVDDFEQTLANLLQTRMKVVPHIVMGLHYGQMLGETNALEIVRRHLPHALVLVVVMPFYANPKRPFATPKANDMGRFFLKAREALPDVPLMLGCARPAGMVKQQLDAYAVMAGLNGIAHPAEGSVELAARLGRPIQVSAACCSFVVGEEVMGQPADSAHLTPDIEQLIAAERAASHRLRHSAKTHIPIIAASKTNVPTA